MDNTPMKKNDRNLSEAELEQLSAMMDGELNETELEKVSSDLGKREEVRKEAETLKKTWDLLDVLPRPMASPHFTQQTLTHLESTKGILLRQGLRWKQVAIAGWVCALITAALLGFWATYYYLQPAPEQAAVTDVLPVEPPHTEPAAPVSPTTPSKMQPTRPAPGPLQVAARLKNERLGKALQQLRNLLQPKLHREDAKLLREASGRNDDPLAYIELLLELAKKYDVSTKNLLDKPASPAPGKTE